MSKQEITRKFDEIVAFAEIEKFIDTPVKHYSTGMYVRLAFAVAAHLESEILFVDEVLAVGDASFQRKCLGKMGDVAKAGRTIVFVSHNMMAMRRLASRAIWLEGGQITECGLGADVIDRYLQKNTKSNLEAVWDEAAAPGDHRVRLHSVRVVPQDGSDGLITVHTSLRIEFIYWNCVPGAMLNVSMILNNLEEVCVLNSGSGIAPPFPIGLIRHAVTIPGDFLNVGSYYINVMIVRDASVGIVLQNNVVAFEVVEGEVVGNWYGRVPGAVRPKLKWETEVMERSNPFTSIATERS